MTPNIMDPKQLAELRGKDFKGDPSFGNAYRQDVVWEYQGPPVRTLDDMTPEEIAAIEQKYGCPVRPKPKEPANAETPFDSTRPVVSLDRLPDAANGRVGGESEQPRGRHALTRTGKRKR